MKMAFMVHNDYYTSRVLDVLKAAEIDYYTRWDQEIGRAHV